MSASTPGKVGLLGALNVKTGQLITKRASVFDGESFGDFSSIFCNALKEKRF